MRTHTHTHRDRHTHTHTHTHRHTHTHTPTPTTHTHTHTHTHTPHTHTHTHTGLCRSPNIIPADYTPIPIQSSLRGPRPPALINTDHHTPMSSASCFHLHLHASIFYHFLSGLRTSHFSFLSPFFPFFSVSVIISMSTGFFPPR